MPWTVGIGPPMLAHLARRYENERSDEPRPQIARRAHSRHQLPIGPLAPHQRVRRAVLDHPAGMQHDDAVEIAQRGRRWAMAITVRPASACSASRMACSHSLSSALVASSSSRIGASFSNARAIARRCRWPPDKLDAAVADHGVEAFRQASMKSRQRARWRRPDLLVGRLRPAVADVFHHRAVEQRDVLRHHGDRRRRLSWVTRAMSWPSIRMRPAGSVIALQQREHGRFAGAGGADQPDPLARLDDEAEAGEDGGFAAIGERTLSNVTRAPRAPAPPPRAGRAARAATAGSQAPRRAARHAG